MATVVPLELTQVASKILRFISLFPPVPVFPKVVNYLGNPYIYAPADYSQDNNMIFPQDYVRDNSLLSFGFPHSIDGPITSLTDPPGVFSIPPNAYAFVARVGAIPRIR